MHGKSWRQSLRQSGHKSRKTATQIMKVGNMIYFTNFHDSYLWQSPRLCRKVGVMEFGLISTSRLKLQAKNARQKKEPLAISNLLLVHYIAKRVKYRFDPCHMWSCDSRTASQWQFNSLADAISYVKSLNYNLYWRIHWTYSSMSQHMSLTIKCKQADYYSTAHCALSTTQVTKVIQ